MAKSKTQPSSSQSNKLTGYFQPRSSVAGSSTPSSQQSSSQPVPSSPLTMQGRGNMDRAGSMKGWKYSNSLSDGSGAGIVPMPDSSPARVVKQERKAFALDTKQQVQDADTKGASTLKRRDTNVMLLDSPTRPTSVISISSGSTHHSDKSVISISSGSFVSDSSGPLIPLATVDHMSPVRSSGQSRSQRGPPATKQPIAGGDNGVASSRLTRSSSRSAVVAPSASASIPSPSKAVHVVEIPTHTPSPNKKSRTMRAGAVTAHGFPDSSSSAPKRKKRASELSDIEEDCIVVVAKPSLSKSAGQQMLRKTPSPRKRQKHDSQHKEASMDLEVVPSSQSDEKEMHAPKATKNFKDVRENVKAWQSSQQRPLSDGNIDPYYDDHSMQLDDFEAPQSPLGHGMSRLGTPTSGRTASDTTLQTPPTLQSSVLPADLPEGKGDGESGLNSYSHLQPSSLPKDEVASRSLHTPNAWWDTPSQPLADHDVVQGCHVRMDSNTKTAAIIEQIKRNAMVAAVTSSPDPEDVQYEDLAGVLSDSDEDELVLIPGRRAATSAAVRSSSPLTELEDDEYPVRRQSTRRTHNSMTPSKIKAASSGRKLRSPRKSSYAETRNLPQVLTSSSSSSSKKPKEKKAVDPFLALVKANGGKRKPAVFKGLTSGLTFKMEDVKPIDVHSSEVSTFQGRSDDEGMGNLFSRSSPNDFDIDLDQVISDSKQRFDIKAEDVIDMKRILNANKAEKDAKGKERATTTFGLEVWSYADANASVESVKRSAHRIPSLGPLTHDGHPSVRLLRRYISLGDNDGVGLLLDSGESVANCEAFFAWLMGLVLSPEKLLALKSSDALQRMCMGANSAQHKEVSARLMVEAFASLGLNAKFAETVHVDPLKQFVTAAHRQEKILILVPLIETLAVAKTFRADNALAECIALLICIAMDRCSDLELQVMIVKAVEVICNVYCTKDGQERSDMELSICRKCLDVAASMSDENKVLFVSFLPGGTPVVQRIKQWIAFGLLGGDTAIDIASESEKLLPPLSSIVSLLEHTSDQRMSDEAVEWFDLSKLLAKKDESAFITLSLKVSVMSGVLSNMHALLVEERTRLAEDRSLPGSQETVPEFTYSPSRNARNKEATTLDVIVRLLLKLGKRIVDGNALEERTCAKAVIERLAMRVNYQQAQANSFGREGGRPKPKKLEQYFGTKSN